MIRRIAVVVIAGMFLAGGARAQFPPAQPGAPGKPGGGESGPAGLGGGQAPGGTLKPGAGAVGKPGSGGSTPMGLSGAGGKLSGAMPGMPGMMGGGTGLGVKKEKELAAMSHEELLAKALKDNPDIRVAESKLQEAEAELNRARLKVLATVTKQSHEIAIARQIVDREVRQFERIKSLLASRAVSQEELINAEFALQRAKAELAKLESELPYLVGKQPPTAVSTGAQVLFRTYVLNANSGDWIFADPRTASTPIADKLQKALEAPITTNFSETPAEDVIDFLREHLKGFNLIVSAKSPTMKITMRLTEPVPLSAALQWLEDEFGWRCVWRDYGIVLAERDRIPPGATPLLELLKKTRSNESKPK